MVTRLIQQTASLLIVTLLVCSQAPAQSQSQKPSPSERLADAQVGPKPDLKRAKKALEAAGKAESEGHTKQALALYEEAARYAPQDRIIVERAAAFRSKIIRGHVEAAEGFAMYGRLEQATNELNEALRIDPGNTIVAERLTEMKSMAPDEAAPANRTPQVIGLPTLQPRIEKHDFNLRGDTKTVYEQVAASFGVKAAFDPDLVSKNVRLRLSGVDFSTTVSILSSQTGTFWRPLNPSLLYVATDTAEKRRQYGLQIEQSFALPAAVAPEEMTELLRALRELTGATHLILDSRSRTITMRDSPERLALAGKIIEQAERARGEVLLEIEFLQVDKNKALQLGITPPASSSLFAITPNDLKTVQASTDLGNLITNLTTIFAAKGFSSVPAFALVGGGLSTFLLTLPTTTANFSDSLSLVQSGRQVLLRAQDGKPATLFVGDRYPVTLSLLSGSGGGTDFVGNPAGITFPQTSVVVGANPVALAANNFTGGTLPDLAVVYNSATANTFSILQNQDNGNFAQFATTPITLGTNETGQVAIGTGTFRNDSNKFGTPQSPDVVLVNSTSNNISVLLGAGDGNCLDTESTPQCKFVEAPGSPFTVGANPSSVAIADFNGDGFLDIAVANKNDNSISVLRGGGDGTFAPFPGSPFLLTNSGSISEKGPVALATGMFRQGDFMDLAVVNQTSGNVSVLLGSVDNNANVTFQEAPGSPIAVQTNPVAIATGDINDDGITDLAVVNQGSNSVSLLLGTSNLDGTFDSISAPPLPTGATPTGISIASFITGAVPDIVVTNQGSNTLSVFIGIGAGAFQTGIELNTPAAPGALITPVLTTSGLPDAAFVAQGSTSGAGVVGIIQDSTDLAASGTGSAQVPYPGSEFIDLGVKVKATPSLHQNNEVTLQLEFEIRALSGSNVNGIPVISNRTLSQTVRLREDETSLIGGITDREETKSITGLPGFAELPAGIGYAFGGRNNTLQDSELLILVTPRRMRSPDHKSEAIFAGRGDVGGRASSGGGGSSPVVPQQPEPTLPPQQPEPEPQQ
ncbi:MAG TPA: FG-GAP-like repeat-containing protein [Candidatus Saccharimonadales bacterium]|nr:FG-GAP-like repeat-containing protein [Candidatus Saccharimonadales bacterium]